MVGGLIMAAYCEHFGYGGQCMARGGRVGDLEHFTVGCEYVNKSGDPVAARQMGCPDYKRPGRVKKRDSV